MSHLLKDALRGLLGGEGQGCREPCPTDDLLADEGFRDLRTLLQRARHSSEQRIQTLKAGLEAPPSPQPALPPRQATASAVSTNPTVEREAAEIRARILGQRQPKAAAAATAAATAGHGGAAAPVPPPFHSRTAAATVGEEKSQPLTWKEQVASDLEQPLRALLLRGTAPALTRAQEEEVAAATAAAATAAVTAAETAPPAALPELRQPAHLVSAMVRDLHNGITQKERAITAALLRKYEGAAAGSAFDLGEQHQEVELAPVARQQQQAHRQPLKPTPLQQQQQQPAAAAKPLRKPLASQPLGSRAPKPSPPTVPLQLVGRGSLLPSGGKQ